MTRPCIIITDTSFSVSEAFNEDGRLICRRADFYSCRAETTLLGYDLVPTNSRLGRTISDKIKSQWKTMP